MTRDLTERVWASLDGSWFNDGAPGDLQMDGFMVSLVAGWHPLVEGARRLKGDKESWLASGPEK